MNNRGFVLEAITDQYSQLKLVPLQANTLQLYPLHLVESRFNLRNSKILSQIMGSYNFDFAGSDKIPAEVPMLEFLQNQLEPITKREKESATTHPNVC